jgi:hypothetical protein
MKSLRDEIHYVDEVRRWRMKSKAKAFGEITAEAISSRK